MKVAICGSGPLAIEMALYLHDMGADVKLFHRDKLGGSIRKMASFLPDFPLDSTYKHLTTETGLSKMGSKLDMDKKPIEHVCVIFSLKIC